MIRVADLVYEDDIELLSEGSRSMKRMTKKLTQEASKVGVEINKRMTKMMSVQHTKHIILHLKERSLRMWNGSSMWAMMAVSTNKLRIDLGKLGQYF